MSDHEARLSRLAERGEAAGAERLIARLEADLRSSRPQVRRLRGLTFGLAAFALVIVVGILTRLVLSDPGPLVSGETMWIAHGDAENTRSVASGPGGFLRVPFVIHQDGPFVEFSEDGRSWEGVGLPGSVSSAVTFVLSTDDTWLVATQSPDSIEQAWRSADGMTWESVEWPDGFDAVYQLEASGQRFLLTSIGEDSTITAWTSVDATAWAEAPPPPGFYVGLLDEFAALPVGSDQPLQLSMDGVTWSPVEAAIGGPGASTEWITRTRSAYIAFIRGADGELTVVTSQDGVTWTEPRPLPFSAVLAGSVFTVASAGDRVAVAPIGAEDGEIWETEDGVNWRRALRTDDQIESIALRQMGDSTYRGVWVGRERDESGASPVTTMLLLPDEDLDQAGLDLQVSILEDGEVTSEEFVQALDGWVGCLAGAGYPGATYELPEEGIGYGREYPSPDDEAEVAERRCWQSYLQRIEEAQTP